MNNIFRKLIYLTASLFITCLMGGCEGQNRGGPGSRGLIPTADLGPTIGSLVELSYPDSIRLEGFSLVGGLRGTGSSECPPQVRQYLRQHIPTELTAHNINIDRMINGLDTAVVAVEGIMPAIAAKNESFDVKVTSLSGTQTTSLEGGYLLNTELKTAGTFSVTTKVIAEAKGPVFIDKTGTSRMNRRDGYVLAGGRVLDEYKITLLLREPDFRMTNIIRNRLNERFGNVAQVVLPGRIDVKVPGKYAGQQKRFISIMMATYINHNPAITQKRINTFVNMLSSLRNSDASEAALEAIGRECLGQLGILLKTSNEQVRFRAARCMLNLGSDAGLAALRDIALDKSSTYRYEALEAITIGARRNDASAIAQRLLRANDFRISLAAYEQLRKLDDIAIARELIANKFFLEQIAQTQHKTIFVSRSGQPRVVLFGAPLYCSQNAFIQSADGNITINAPAGQKYVSIIRKHPERPNAIIQLKSSFKIDDIIRTLCENPLSTEQEKGGGLGVCYTDLISLLKLMCDKGAIRAEFRAGPLPKIG